MLNCNTNCQKPKYAYSWYSTSCSHAYADLFGFSTFRVTAQNLRFSRIGDQARTNRGDGIPYTVNTFARL